jgi:hypothetical protein
MIRVSTVWLARICALTSRSISRSCSLVTGSKWEKSKRRRSGRPASRAAARARRAPAQRRVQQVRRRVMQRGALAQVAVDGR